MKFLVEKRESDKVEQLYKQLPAERAVTIYLNEKELVTIAASPTDLKELAVGFLYTEGIIDSYQEIKRLDIDKDNYVWIETFKELSLEKAKKRILTSGCGKGISLMLSLKKLAKNKAKVKVDKDYLLEKIKEVLKMADSHKISGGTHTASIFSKEKKLTLKEDIGRHNGLDKVIGDLLIKDILTEGVVLFSTGRISSEMALKGIRSEIPIVASLSSPTDAAVELGEKYGLTILGYTRGRRVSIYSYPERIV
jgi:FdhD protein